MALLRRSLVVSLPVALLAVGAGALAPTPLQLEQVAPFAGHDYAACLATSANGSVTVGMSSSMNETGAFVLRGGGSLAQLPKPAGATDAYAVAVSADGRASAGFVFFPGTDRAVRWTAAGVEDLGVLSGAQYGSQATGISRDGSVVCGSSAAPVEFHAFRWTAAGGMQDLGVLPGGAYSWGFAVSANGKAVTGFSDSVVGEQAFRWTAQQGMQPLASLVPGEWAGGFAISSNGKFVTGYSGPTAVRWDAAGIPEDLGLLPGGFFSVGYAISGNGQLVGGAADDASGAFQATIWTEQLGMVDLLTFLPTIGVDTTDWNLDVTAGISEDGRTLVGIGSYQGESRGWVLRLPSNGSAGWLRAQ